MENPTIVALTDRRPVLCQGKGTVEAFSAWAEATWASADVGSNGQSDCIYWNFGSTCSATASLELSGQGKPSATSWQPALPNALMAEPQAGAANRAEASLGSEPTVDDDDAPSCRPSGTPCLSAEPAPSSTAHE